MVKFMKQGRVVLITQGRFAGCKAVIVQVNEPSKKYKFHHCIVAGISKAPRKIARSMNRTQIREKSKMNTFIKIINQIHLMPTRYKIKLDIGRVTTKNLHPKDGKKMRLRKNIRQKFKRMYFKNSKPSTRWFFKKLYF